MYHLTEKGRNYFLKLPYSESVQYQALKALYEIGDMKQRQLIQFLGTFGDHDLRVLPAIHHLQTSQYIELK